MEMTQPENNQPEEPALEDTAPRTVAKETPLEETHPTPVTPIDEASTPQEPVPPHRSRLWILWAIGGLLFIMIVGLLSVYGGYLAAMRERTTYKSTQVSTEAQTQYALALEDIANNRFENARQRLEYVINLDPGFPGAADRLAEVMVAMSITATPTVAPSPTPSPTPDLRAREELYLRAREQMAGNDWSGAIDTLLTLRKKDPAYMAVDVDGLLFMALRNRGVDKIARSSDLEGGTYDLSLAEAFGPLDVEARNWRDWAALYTRGASFWGVDWAQAVFYFGQIAAIAPNLMDGSRITATQRYYDGLIEYGDWLALQGLWCDAQVQYETAMNFRSSPELAPTVDVFIENCANPPEGTPGPGDGTGSETPVETPTETPATIEPEAPIETPTETPSP
jgi:tetratricopeptide (TPR) repeat protein